MPYHMPNSHSSHPLAYEPDAAAEQARADSLEKIMRRQQRLTEEQQPTPPPPLRVTVRDAGALPPARAGGAGEVRTQADGSARLEYATRPAHELPAAMFHGSTFAVLVDTQSALAPVVTASLRKGVKSVRVFASGNDILSVKANPQPAMMGPRLWGGSRTDSALLDDDATAVGGVMFETQASAAVKALEAEAARAAEELAETKVAGLNTTLRNPLEKQNTEIHVGPMQKAERRLAAISDQLREARAKVVAGGTAKELMDTDDLAGMIALGAQRGDAIRQRALESEMAATWRGTSMLECVFTVTKQDDFHTHMTVLCLRK